MSKMNRVRVQRIPAEVPGRQTRLIEG